MNFKKYWNLTKWTYNMAKGSIVSVILLTLAGSSLSIIGVALAVLSKSIIDNAAESDVVGAIHVGIVFGVFILLELIISAFDTAYSIKIWHKLANKARLSLFYKLSNSDWMKYNSYHSSELLIRVSDDVAEVVDMITETIPQVVAASVKLISAVGVLLVFEPMLALFAFVFGPFAFLVNRFAGRKMKKYSIESHIAQSNYKGYLQENLNSMLVVKAFSLQNHTVEKLSNLQNTQLRWIYKKNNLGIIMNTIKSIGKWTGYFLAFAWGSYGISKGLITFGTFTAFLQLFGQIQTPMSTFAGTLSRIVEYLNSAERLIELEKMPMEKSNNVLPSWSNIGLEIKGLDFEYNGGKLVLKNISMKILEGDILAILGNSGEGKTTLIRIILALLQPTKGNVEFFNDKNERIVACSATRDWISYVPQGNTLFSGTIYDNIKCGNLNASSEEVVTAAKIACSWEFINELPEGIHTIIGERGVGLSEGQAQRIAIARAFIRPAPILILDEATSALDQDLERKILGEIAKMSPKRTCIVITHRTSALSICSGVLKLDKSVKMEYSKI